MYSVKRTLKRDRRVVSQLWEAQWVRAQLSLCQTCISELRWGLSLPLKLLSSSKLHSLADSSVAQHLRPGHSFPHLARDSQPPPF